MLVDNDGGPASLAPCFVRIALFTYIYVHSHLLSSSDRITFFSAITFTVWFLTPLVIVHRCLHALGLDVRACFLPVALSFVVCCVASSLLLLTVTHATASVVAVLDRHLRARGARLIPCSFTVCHFLLTHRPPLKRGRRTCGRAFCPWLCPLLCAVWLLRRFP